MIDRKPEFVLGIVGSILNLLIGIIVIVALIILPIVTDNLQTISDDAGITYETHLEGTQTYDLDADDEEVLMMVYDIIQVVGIFAIVFMVITAVIGFVMSARVVKKTQEKATTEGIVFIVLAIVTSLNVFLLIAGILALSRNPKLDANQN